MTWQKAVAAATLAITMVVGGCGSLPAVQPGLPTAQMAMASTSALTTHTLSTCLGLLKVRVGVQKPAGEIKGDVLYLHGFADRLDNHGPLFKAWTDAGLRVISFDLPSHGENSGLKNRIDLFGFEELADLAKDVEADTREDARRPLLLAGWSTGGLLAVRMAQTDAMRGSGRKVSGLVLFAPGVAVYPLVGEKGIVTQRSLTNNPNPPHKGPISPASPLLTPIFSSKLLLNAGLARHETLPGKLPSLVMVADDEADVYADSAKVRQWAIQQRDSHRAGLVGLSFPGAKHELDNEPGQTGSGVREAAAAFAQAVATGQDPAGIPVGRSAVRF
jgi:alpha-beta hydrolase superfamily lysophospholipase